MLIKKFIEDISQLNADFLNLQEIKMKPLKRLDCKISFALSFSIFIRQNAWVILGCQFHKNPNEILQAEDLTYKLPDMLTHHQDEYVKVIECSDLSVGNFSLDNVDSQNVNGYVEIKSLKFCYEI
jgi:hypothetical protein